MEQSDTKAVNWYRKSADLGDADAQLWIGDYYSRGELVAKNKVEAVKWYLMAAEQDDAQAQGRLGVCYRAGAGVEKDYAEAYAWFNLASLSDTIGASARSRDEMEKTMSPQQIGDAQKRTKELREKIGAKPQSRKWRVSNRWRMMSLSE